MFLPSFTLDAQSELPKLDQSITHLLLPSPPLCHPVTPFPSFQSLPSHLIDVVDSRTHMLFFLQLVLGLPVTQREDHRLGLGHTEKEMGSEILEASPSTGPPVGPRCPPPPHAPIQGHRRLGFHGELEGDQFALGVVEILAVGREETEGCCCPAPPPRLALQLRAWGCRGCTWFHPLPT